MKKRIKKKLQSNRGETIAEVLAALLVVTLAFMELSGAIAAAARVNAKVKTKDLSYRIDEAVPVGITLTVSGLPDGAKTVPVTGYMIGEKDTDFTYYYYEYSRGTGE